MTKKKVVKEKTSPFSKGYGAVRQRVGKGSRYTMSCFNCEYYYQSEEDEEELCQNTDVLPYDMVVSEGNVYCNQWSMTRREDSVKGILKKKRGSV